MVLQHKVSHQCHHREAEETSRLTVVYILFVLKLMID